MNMMVDNLSIAYLAPSQKTPTRVRKNNVIFITFSNARATVVNDV